MGLGRRFVLGIGATIVAGGVWADCADDIAALYEDGPLDSFSLPPYRIVSTTYDADGVVKMVSDMIVQSPTRIVSGVRDSGQVMLMIGLETWMGPDLDGPWQYMGQMQGIDAEAAQQAVVDDEQANISAPECLGTVDLNDVPHNVYRFNTQTLPHQDRGNSWFGGQKTVFVDTQTGLPSRVEVTNHIASWFEGVNDDTQVNDYVFDPAIVVQRPAD